MISLADKIKVFIAIIGLSVSCFMLGWFSNEYVTSATTQEKQENANKATSSIPYNIKVGETITFSIKPVSKTYYYTPQPDITAYEVAKILEIVYSYGYKDIEIEFTKQPTLRRHFSETNPNSTAIPK